MGGAVVITILALGAGVLGLFLLTSEAEAAPPPTTEIPTADDIMGAQSVDELNAWYNLIGELYIIGEIGPEEYMALYEAYRERWYQITGVAE